MGSCYFATFFPCLLKMLGPFLLCKNPMYILNSHSKTYLSMWRAGLQGGLISVLCVIQFAITIWNLARKSLTVKPSHGGSVRHLKMSNCGRIRCASRERHYITSVPACSQAMAPFWAAAKWPTRRKQRRGQSEDTWKWAGYSRQGISTGYQDYC